MTVLDTIGQVPEWDLVAQAQAGDMAAFAELWSRYRVPVKSYLMVRTRGNHTQSDDLTSETFLRALRRIDSATWMGKGLGAWLITIARNLLHDDMKCLRTRVEVFGEDPRDLDFRWDSVVESDVTDRDLMARVLRHIEKDLTPHQQICLRMFCLLDMSVNEIAAELGIKIGAVKARIHRARERLRALVPEEVR